MESLLVSFGSQTVEMMKLQQKRYLVSKLADWVYWPTHLTARIEIVCLAGQMLLLTDRFPWKRLMSYPA